MAQRLTLGGHVQLHLWRLDVIVRDFTLVKSSLGRAIVEVGQAVQKEKRAFYLATLLDFSLAGRKEPRHQILAEIYRLKTSGAFTFYAPGT